jgi:two-component system chemotaxis response regulator CheB
MNPHSELRASQIRVLIVDSSAFMRSALSRIVALEVGLRVVGTAGSEADALLAIATFDPDVVTLDVGMPGFDGLETLRRIMAEFPRPVIMVSSATLAGAEITLNALAAGAFDCVAKQLSSSSLDVVHIRFELISKIRAAGELRQSRSPLKLPPQTSGGELPIRTVAPFATIVALASSTGGLKALEEILPLLPGDLAVPILVVQHMPTGLAAPFAERLSNLCALAVCEASHGNVIRPATVYFAPAGSHMTVGRLANSRTVICLSSKPKDQMHIPSADVMMRSVAFAFQSQAMGVILTGMGADGAQGMNAIHREGGLTVGQDERSCVIYGMPRVCAKMGILDKVVPLCQIPQEILQATRYRKISAS